MVSTSIHPSPPRSRSPSSFALVDEKTAAAAGSEQCCLSEEVTGLPETTCISSRGNTMSDGTEKEDKKMKIYHVQPIESNINFLKYWLQTVAALVACLSILSSGIHYAWSSPTLPKLFAADSPIHITDDDGALLAIIPLIASVIGACTAAITCDIVGRKLLILITSPIYLTSWVLIALATNLPMLLAARGIAGLADGMGFTAIPIYICEIADSQIRGALGSLVPIMLTVGIVLINSIGPFLDISTMAYVWAVVPVVQLIIFIMMPESPYYLLMKHQVDKARESLVQLRREDDVENELIEIKAAVDRQMSESGKFWDLFIIKSNRKALLIALGLRGFQQLAGQAAFVLYTQMIFQEAGGDFSPITSAIIFSGIQLAVCIILTAFIDRIGRRPAMIWSTAGCAVFLIIEGIYFCLKDKSNIDLTIVNWLPVMAMLAYDVIFSFGLATIPIFMLGELFSASVKTYAMGFIDIFYAMMASLTGKFFQVTSSAYGTYVPFFAFALCTVISVFFSYFCVPETKGKTLEEIQMWMKGSEPAYKCKEKTSKG